MGKSNRRKLAVLLVLLLGLIIVFVWWNGARGPRLTVTFLTTTKSSGRLIAHFAITNVGDATAMSFAQGRIEIFGQPQPLTVACRAGVHRLSPGEGDLVQVFLPQRFDSRWKFTCLYARAGLRSRIYDWQWGKGGPGARANWLVPQFLKGVPLDVNGTSDWIEE